MKLFGIRNCATLKKAFAWLDAWGVTDEFAGGRKLGGVERYVWEVMP
jgi:arsenate reductase-like glutaredoxin family protein